MSLESMGLLLQANIRGFSFSCLVTLQLIGNPVNGLPQAEE